MFDSKAFNEFGQNESTGVAVALSHHVTDRCSVAIG
jgi:hypothetical protein